MYVCMYLSLSIYIYRERDRYITCVLCYMIVQYSMLCYIMFIPIPCPEKFHKLHIVPTCRLNFFYELAWAMGVGMNGTAHLAILDI